MKCNYCGREYEIGDYVNVYNHNKMVAHYKLCAGCLISAIQALELGKQVTEECLKDGRLARKIYVAVESIGPQSSELMSVKEWTGQGLKASA